MIEYKFIQKLNDDLIGLWHPKYGKQLWIKIKTRKGLLNNGRLRCCTIIGEGIPEGAYVYRPMTNGYNRMERISIKGMKMLEANR